MDRQNDPVRPGALSDLVAGIEDEVRGHEPEIHVVFFDPSGDAVPPDEKRVFTDEAALNAWTRERPGRTVVFEVRYTDDAE